MVLAPTHEGRGDRHRFPYIAYSKVSGRWSNTLVVILNETILGVSSGKARQS